MIFADGSLAVALVKDRVMVVQGTYCVALTATSRADDQPIATRTHSAREKYLDVHTFAPFGAGVFLASDVPCARIAPADVLAILPPRSPCELAEGLLELPQQEYSQYIAHSSRHQKRHESMWTAWLGRK